MTIRTLAKRLLTGVGVVGTYNDRAFRMARAWSNRELEKFAHLFSGKIVNVSAWEDKDKEGRRYRDYFHNASSYHITNFGTEQGVLQGAHNEVFLDLEKPLPGELVGAFDTVFNHTTLEHIYEFRVAFSNMCQMASDTVVIVVPWLQPLHSNYGDYWRFSPQAVARLFAENGFHTLHLSWSKSSRASVYVFAVATRNLEAWRIRFGEGVDFSRPDFLQLPSDFAGKHAF